jgi:hypothetical protein
VPAEPIILPTPDGVELRIRQVEGRDRASWGGDRSYGIITSLPVSGSDLVTGSSLPAHVLDQVGAGDELVTPDQRVASATTQFEDRYKAIDLERRSLRVYQVIDLMRLLVEAEIQIAFAEVWIPSRIPRAGSCETRYAELTNRVRPTDPWSLSPSVANTLRRYWESLTAGPNAARLTLPLRRFGLSATRRWDEDRLIDAWVALESLFKQTGESRDVAERIKPRLLSLLDGGDPTKLHIDLRDSYRVRNRIVHGGDYGQAEVDSAMASAAQALKLALIALLNARVAIDPTQLGTEAG